MGQEYIIILNVVVRGRNEKMFGSFQNMMTKWSPYGK